MTNTSDGVTAYPGIAVAGTAITPTMITGWASTDSAASYHYTITPVATNSIFTIAADGKITVTTPTALSESTTEQFTITLYAGNGTTLAGSTHFKEIASKKVSITAEPAKGLTYSLVNSKNATLNTKTANNIVELSLEAVDSDGNAVAADINELKTVSVDNSSLATVAIKNYAGGTATSAQAVQITSKAAATGTEAGTINVTAVIGANSQVVTLEVPYDVAAPVATDVVITKKAVYNDAWDSTSNNRSVVSGTTLDNVVIAGSAGAWTLTDGTDQYFIQEVDQYGKPIAHALTDVLLTGWSGTSATAKAVGSTGLTAATAADTTGTITLSAAAASRSVESGDSFILNYNTGKLNKQINVNIKDGTACTEYLQIATTAEMTQQNATAFGTAYTTGSVVVKDQFGRAITTRPAITGENLTVSRAAAASAATIAMTNAGTVTLTVTGTTTAFVAGDTLTYDWTLAGGNTYRFTATVVTPKTTPTVATDTDTTATLSLTLVTD